MKLVERSEIVDYQTYEDTRKAFRAEVLMTKAPRRIHIGEAITLLFENHLTIRYQIQEMMRAERIVKEANIVHEINTYNELLGQQGELGATMLIEIEDPAIRQIKLKEWWQLPERIYLLLEDKTRTFAKVDERQREEGKLSSVQFLKFFTGGKTPIAAGVDFDKYMVETKLTDQQKEALKKDLE
jgi:hypothetical protein